RHGGAARKGDGHARRQFQPRRRLRGECQDDERIVLGLLTDQPIIAGTLQYAGIGGDGGDVERLVGRTQSGIDLAEREKGLDSHVGGSVFGGRGVGRCGGIPDAANHAMEEVRKPIQDREPCPICAAPSSPLLPFSRTARFCGMKGLARPSLSTRAVTWSAFWPPSTSRASPSSASC